MMSLGMRSIAGAVPFSLASHLPYCVVLPSSSRSAHMSMVSFLSPTRCACRSLTALAKSSAGSLPLAPRALVAGDQEDLVHADVEGVGRERVDQLVDQGEDHAVDIRMERAPAPAIDSLVVGGDVGCLIKLRVLLQERRRVPGPRLMAQAIEHGDQPDSPLAAEGRQVAGVVLVHPSALAELGMRLVVEPVIDFEHHDVDPQGLHPLVDRALEERQVVPARGHQMDGAPGRVAGRGLAASLREGEARQGRERTQ